MTNYRETTAALLALAGVGGILVSAAAVAQEVEIEEVLVTARKKAEDLQETPLAISAFTAKQIEEQGISSIDDVALRTPGFSFLSAAGRQDFFRPVIRGQSNILGDANASFFIDGVFVNGAISTLTLDSVERVEVIKGPQSALFGRATFAGAINYVTKRPGDELAGKLSLTAGEDGDYRGSANISGPIIAEKLSFFLGASADTFDGQYRARRTDGSTMSIGATQTMGVEGGLFASPTDNLDIRLRVSYSESDDGFYADALQLSSANNFSLFNAVSNPYSPGYFRGTVKSDPSSFSNNCLEIEQLSAANGDRVTCGITTDTLRIHLVGDLDIGGWKLSQSVAYNEFNGRTVADGDYTAVFGVSGFIQLDFGSVMTDRAFETRLSSPASRRIRGSVGYYNYKKDEDDPQFRAFTSVGVVVTPPKDLEDTNNQAVFGSVEMDLTETLIASIEARYGEDEKILNEGRVVTVARGTPQAFATSAAATFYSFTPRVTLSWNAAADTHLYAYAAKGNKPGGFNTRYYEATTTAAAFESAAQAGELTFGEEEAWTYEVGAKTTWFEKRVLLNVAAYYVDWKQQQLTSTRSIDQTTGVPFPASIIQNVGKTEVKGLELEASWRATDRLSISGTLAYTDATFKEFSDLQQALLFDFEDGTIDYRPNFTASQVNAFVEREGSLAGNRLPLVSEWQYSLSTAWKDRLANTRWDWFARADYQVESSRFAQIHNLAETGDTENLGIRVGVRNDSLSITGWVSNVTDQKGPTVITRGRDYTTGTRTLLRENVRGFQYVVPRGRQVGISVTMDF